MRKRRKKVQVQGNEGEDQPKIVSSFSGKADTMLTMLDYFQCQS